jgi:alkanesulfonate monooxygenase SsuD/methylene tetrahydromethanopterin reductase-like flavin-dependent oxidoreductase (luciferase family)
MQKILIGIHLPVMGFDNANDYNKEGKIKSANTQEQILSIVKKAEFLGYDSLSVNDHIVFRTSWLDSLSILAAAAAVTNKIKLGTSILNIVVRTPVICANALTAIDILSSGRLFAAGVGPGSHKGDYDVCGIPFEQRWGRFNEAIEILHTLWNYKQAGLNKAVDTVDYNGKYYQLDKVVLTPRPYQKPHPPIFIGTWGESEAGLKRVAKYSDGWMASAYNITPQKFKEKWDMLLAYRKKLGKDTKSFDNSLMSMFGYIDNDNDKVKKKVKDILSPALGRPSKQLEDSLLFGSVEECIQKVNAFYEAGAKRIHFWPISDFDEQIEVFKKEIAGIY